MTSAIHPARLEANNRIAATAIACLALGAFGFGMMIAIDRLGTASRAIASSCHFAEDGKASCHFVQAPDGFRIEHVTPAEFSSLVDQAHHDIEIADIAPVEDDASGPCLLSKNRPEALCIRPEPARSAYSQAMAVSIRFPPATTD